MLTILGGSVLLVGLLLVLWGFLYAKAASFSREEVSQRFKRLAQIGTAPLVFALIIVGSCVWWLLYPSLLLFWLCWFGSWLLLWSTGVYVVFVIYSLKARGRPRTPSDNTQE